MSPSRPQGAFIPLLPPPLTLPLPRNHTAPFSEPLRPTPPPPGSFQPHRSDPLQNPAFPARRLHLNQPQDISTVSLLGLSDPHAIHADPYRLRSKFKIPTQFRRTRRRVTGTFKRPTNSDPGKPGELGGGGGRGLGTGRSIAVTVRPRKWRDEVVLTA